MVDSLATSWPNTLSGDLMECGPDVGGPSPTTVSAVAMLTRPAGGPFGGGPSIEDDVAEASVVGERLPAVMSTTSSANPTSTCPSPVRKAVRTTGGSAASAERVWSSATSLVAQEDCFCALCRAISGSEAGSWWQEDSHGIGDKGGSIA
jgi:hypothetical protein